MNKRQALLRDLTAQEYRKFILPIAMAGLVILLGLLLNTWQDHTVALWNKYTITILTAGAAIYITLSSFYLIPARKNKDLAIWINAILSGIGFFLLVSFIPDKFAIYIHLLLLLTVVSVSVYAGRLPTLLTILMTTASHLLHHARAIQSVLGWTEHLGVPLAAVLLNDLIVRLQDLSRRQIHRLEIINTFSRQVAATLDREQILAYLNTTIPNALISDSYYVSVVDNGEVHVLICYDDGEYFNNLTVPAEGTLTNWVVQNQKELFLPDLRQPLELEGVKIILVGKDKTSLSWIGVPMTSTSFKGVLALGSYQPNAFNRGDVELLSSLAQYAALALDTSIRHAEVQERSRLDSLTGVFNHGYFLETLKQQADEVMEKRVPLSIIMLDVDHFKQYNDTYGHLAGDQILTALCKTIRSHIKSADTVGRWGGEEFVVSLPNTTVSQAKAVAIRISNSMRELLIRDRAGEPIPPPTVSQGIAAFPLETSDIFKLIDLADQRLYTAKNRGRDQIEIPPQL